MGDSCCCICLELICAIILPPLGVLFRHGCCSLEFCICLVLTILGYVPGIIYAVYVIVCVDRRSYQRGSIYYYYNSGRDPDDDCYGPLA